MEAGDLAGTTRVKRGRNRPKFPKLFSLSSLREAVN